MPSNRTIETLNEKPASEDCSRFVQCNFAEKKGPANWTFGRFDGRSFCRGANVGVFRFALGYETRGGARPGPVQHRSNGGLSVTSQSEQEMHAKFGRSEPDQKFSIS
jgi:hypothetical protein